MDLGLAALGTKMDLGLASPGTRGHAENNLDHMEYRFMFVRVTEENPPLDTLQAQHFVHLTGLSL